LKQKPHTTGADGVGVEVGVAVGVGVGVAIPPIAPGGSPIAVGAGEELAVGDGVASAAQAWFDAAPRIRAPKINPVKRLFTVLAPLRGLGWVIDTDYF
jgi:hypothetical protein